MLKVHCIIVLILIIALSLCDGVYFLGGVFMKSKFESAHIKFYCDENIDALYFTSVVCKPLTKIDFFVENSVDGRFFYRVDILKDSKRPSLFSMVKAFTCLNIYQQLLP